MSWCEMASVLSSTVLNQWFICLNLVIYPWWSEQCRRPGFDSWVGKIPWRRAGQPTPVFLPGGFHGQRSLAGDHVTVGSQRVGPDWVTRRSVSSRERSPAPLPTLSRPLLLPPPLLSTDFPVGLTSPGEGQSEGDMLGIGLTLSDVLFYKNMGSFISF